MSSTYRSRRLCCTRADVRRGAAAVEFAISAAVLMFVMFAFFEFGRAMLIESFVENAAFRAARHVAVLGATKDEAIQLAKSDLQILGVDNATIAVQSFTGQGMNDRIDGSTERIRVSVTVPMGENILFGSLFRDSEMQREAIVMAERVR